MILPRYLIFFCLSFLICEKGIVKGMKEVMQIIVTIIMIMIIIMSIDNGYAWHATPFIVT